ncbi:hypothetical protein [Flagellimonas myxillae]|uniref:hypothetical protein n=1 Tax=Flagellimonas myxillae TaxID=2942214 RepID=UPI00201F21E9|nr:hypothetical protein [Muricauda myxillae]MCL6266228.1 hypothetical protein [Muricauda myxillae]
MKSNLIVLAQSLEQPRIVKRINQKAKEYESVHVYGFTRNVHSVENHEVLAKNKNVTLTVAGQLKNGRYLERIFTFLRLLKTLYAKYGFGKKSVYVFGLDLRIFASFLVNAKIDYEISDIVWLYDRKGKKGIMRFMDNWLAGKSRKVVFTTRSFYDGYYSKSVNEEQVVIAENKLETYGKVQPISEMRDDKVRIAYIGAFRYAKIIEHLISSVNNNPNLVLNFYGATHGKLIETINQATASNPNISYHGPFKNPDDLERIYGENNLNFVVYNNASENEQVAMPNKFYESGFFNIPIVCATKTYVGERVLKQNMGWTIDTDYDSISNFLNELDVQKLRGYHENIKRLDKGYFVA